MIPPSGQDSLAVREAYLHQRAAARRFGDRSLRALWVAMVVTAMWLFIAAFAGLGH